MTRVPPDDGGGLFPPARHDGPETSHQAARKVAPRTPTMRERVLACIVAAGSRGLTDAEGERVSGMRSQSWTPRRGELVKQGRVIDSGERRTTESGCEAIVWVAVEHAKAGGGA